MHNCTQGDEYGRMAWILRSDLPCRVASVEARHMDVEWDDVRTCPVDSVDRFLTVECALRAVAQGRKHLGRCFRQRLQSCHVGWIDGIAVNCRIPQAECHARSNCRVHPANRRADLAIGYCKAPVVIAISHGAGDGKSSWRKATKAFTLGLARRLSGHTALMVEMSTA